VLQRCGASLPALYSLIIRAYRAQRAFSISLLIVEFVGFANLMKQV
jgi:hypothetical protein